METSELCRFPADDGMFYPRCKRIILPRSETEYRQCRRAAVRGEEFCDAHHQERGFGTAAPDK